MYTLIQLLIFFFFQPVHKSAFIFMALSFLFLGMAMNIHNNIIDKEIDRDKKNFRDFNTNLYLKIYYLFLLIFVLFLFLSTSNFLILASVLFSGIFLWLYNKYFKRTPFYGNFIVALVISISIVMPGWVGELQDEKLYFVLIFLGIYAFTLNLMRELVKDMEDLKIDKKAGFRTLAVLDLETAQRYEVILSGILLSSIFFIRSFVTSLHFWGLYLITFSLTIITLYLIKKKRFKEAGDLLKLLMLLGFVIIITGINS